jgi:hypothetical protein
MEKTDNSDEAAVTGQVGRLRAAPRPRGRIGRLLKGV